MGHLAVLPRPVDVDAVVDQLNAATVRAGLRFAVEVGRIVLDAFFDGDPDEFRNPSRSKQQSLRQLAEHPRMQLRFQTLHAYVSVSIQLRELPPAVAYKLPLQHHRLLLTVEDRGHRARLAARAAREEWDRDRMRLEVARATPEGARTGRPRDPAPVLLVKRLRRALTPALREELGGAPIRPLKPGQAREVADELGRMIATLEATRRCLMAQEAEDEAS